MTDRVVRHPIPRKKRAELTILGRILIILAVALLVVAATCAFARSSPGAEVRITFSDNVLQGDSDATGNGLGLGFRRLRTWNLFIVTELLRSLMIIAVIILVVAPLTYSARKRGPVSLSPPPAPPSSKLDESPRVGP